jgi:hypothetical protein
MTLSPHIEKDGQEFFDEYATPNKAGMNVVLTPKPIAAAFGAKPITATFNRVRLRWMKPGQDGTLVPK